jgi:hypothetical protein
MPLCRSGNPHHGYGGDDDNSCKPYGCSWDKVRDLCDDHLKKMRFFTGLNFYDPEWVKLLRQGSQQAMLGVIIASTPRIQNLALLNYSGAYWIGGDYVLEPGHLDCSDMFGTIAKAQTFSIAWIPGLATPTSLSSNCLLSSHFTTLPNLINLRFDLPNEGQELLPQPPRSADVCAWKICRLGITLDQKSLSADGWRDHYKYSRQLSERLHKLRHLDLVIKPVFIGDPWSRDYGEAGGSYANLIEKFLSASIETLTIDTTLLNDQDNQIYESEWHYWRYGGRYNASERYMRWTQELRPIASLTRFTKLRKIVAAQEAFFSVDESFSICELSASIEETEMFDTSCAVDRWVGDMLDNKHKYPNLNTITCWGKSDRWECVFKWDPRLDEESDFPWDDYDSYGYEEDESTEVKTDWTDADGDEEMGGVEDEAKTGNGSDDDDDADKEDEEDMEYDPTEDRPPLGEWKVSFAKATRGSSAVDCTNDVGVDVREEYCYEYSCIRRA